MKHDIQDLIEHLWNDYASLNHQARRINELLKARGLVVTNDHIALRTYNDPRVNIDALGRSFLQSGYTPKGSYVFKEKGLAARHYEHPDGDLPKVFISQLMVEQFPDEVGTAVQELVDQVTDDLTKRWDFPVSGRPWRSSYKVYELLGKYSEYAAWLSAFGFRANHFTIDVGRLTSLNDLAEFNAFIESNGITLNSTGGRIKGSMEIYLEQSSTMAPEVPVRFTDGTYPVPGCYYEFAKRYDMPTGERFEGFVAKSADKIFESTDRQP